jgi:glycine cleavage system regulatory protein
MDQSTASSSTEDLSSTTTDTDNTSLTLDIQPTVTIDSNIQSEQLQTQIQELTKQLNESMKENF